VKGCWTYLYRAIDSRGQTIDFLLSTKRDAAAAKHFFRNAREQPHTVNPRVITADKNPAHPRAVAEFKDDGELWQRSRLRQVIDPALIDSTIFQQTWAHATQGGGWAS
jgi:transposase-like protein